MAVIKSATPVAIAEEFGEWFIPSMNISADPAGEWKLTAIFTRSRTLDETVMTTNEDGEATPLLDRAGGEVKKVDFLVRSDGSHQVVHTIPDIQKVACEAAAAGDTSLKDAIDTILTFLTVDAFTKGAIS